MSKDDSNLKCVVCGNVCVELVCDIIKFMKGDLVKCVFKGKFSVNEFIV